MNSDKQKYLTALKANNGQLDEIALGEKLGFTEVQTNQIIADLLTDNKIEFQSFGLCSYRPKE
jgi:hypothetical protein